MELVIEIDARNKDGKNLIEYLKKLSYVKFSEKKKTLKKSKLSAYEKKIEESIRQIEEGDCIRFKSAEEARRYCDAL